MKEADKVKDVQELNKEVKDMRKEIDSMKELLGGLIKVMMEHDDQFNGEDEYN
ncbi:hypothetical protein [Ferroplasma sp.]|jgi:uncharacterized coiled-coil protein SlyX|uniref:hypothetical protein n=1 Tax=Ferroplasma sp. TaxID=2591003 RepID=UPI0026085904|nr:hypothetical protein [Ferroplasma sp.]MCL4452547.1 hypothetical protein [Candidatus Thermoplasmatota archaeon]WMT51317.1 MAG: hypothetical protein RE471_00170 [Ferroplasma sp.]